MKARHLPILAVLFLAACGSSAPGNANAQVAAPERDPACATCPPECCAEGAAAPAADAAPKGECCASSEAAPKSECCASSGSAPAESCCAPSAKAGKQ